MNSRSLKIIRRRKIILRLLILEFILIFSLVYGIYLYFIYPVYIPNIGFKDRVELSQLNNYSHFITLYSRGEGITIYLKGSKYFDVFSDNNFLGRNQSFELYLPPQSLINLLIYSDSENTVVITGRRDFPLYKVLTISFIGIISAIYFIIIYHRLLEE